MKRPKNGEARPGLFLPRQAAERIARMPRKLADRACTRCNSETRSKCIVCEGKGTVRWLFETPQGGHFRKSKCAYYWAPVRSAFGRPDLEFYALRHSGATLFLERGVTVEDCAFQLGHTDGGTLIRELYGEPHREAAARRQRIRRAFGQNVEPLRSEGVRDEQETG